MSKRLKIRRLDKVRSDSHFIVEAQIIRFMNKGNSRIWIDEQEVLEPGEAFEEGDTDGPGFRHSYKIDFIPLDNPPSTDVPAVYNGNMLKMRVFTREK